MSEFSRTELLLGREAVERLSACRVAVFGVGGVGGYCVEGLARAGVGALDLIDSDRVSLSNLNRQIVALHSTVGRLKTKVAAERVRDISPACKVRRFDVFYLPETENMFDFSGYDYVVDAVDTLTAKLSIVRRATECGVPVISAMGAGNKLDPTKFEVTDIFRTSICPLARAMRRELKKIGIERLKVVCSTEPPVRPKVELKGENGKVIPGSVSFVPSVAGLILAGEVVKDLTVRTQKIDT